MSEDEKPRGSWWQTVPGMLTALSGVFTAVAGLLIALNQVGFLGFKDKLPTASPSATSSTSSSEPSRRAQQARPADPATASAASPAGTQNQADSTRPRAQNSAPHYQISFPSGNEATVANYASEAIFTVLKTEVTPKSAGKLSLKFFIRLTNKGRTALSFGSDSFRLQVDGIPRTPANWVNDMVEARSAKEADFLFEIPETTRTLELAVDTGQDNATIPLGLKAVH